MVQRSLAAPESSFFLLGPRGTGKTTWIGQRFPGATVYDLLRADEHVRLARDPAALERGFLFETFLLHELRAHLAYNEIDAPVHFWRTHDGTEVDFVVETERGLVAIEAKSSERWDLTTAPGSPASVPSIAACTRPLASTAERARSRSPT